MFEERMTRRDALKKAAYITPVILTFLAAPSFASGGSGTSERYERYDEDKETTRVKAMEKEEIAGSGIMNGINDAKTKSIGHGARKDSAPAT